MNAAQSKLCSKIIDPLLIPAVAVCQQRRFTVMTTPANHIMDQRSKLIQLKCHFAGNDTLKIYYRLQWITSARCSCCRRRNWRWSWCRSRRRRRGSRAGAERLVADGTELERMVSLSLPAFVALSVLFLTRSAQEITLQANIFLTMETESLASTRHVCVNSRN